MRVYKDKGEEYILEIKFCKVTPTMFGRITLNDFYYKRVALCIEYKLPCAINDRQLLKLESILCMVV